jgi:hypothetical protein
VVDNKQIEYLANRILAGKKIFSYQNSQYEIRKPSLKIKVEADILYQETYENNLFNDFILLEDVPFLCIDIGLISHNYEQSLKDYEKRLEGAKLDYFSFYANIEKRKKNKVKINNIKQQYQSYLDKVHYLDHISLEHYCSKAKNEFIIVNTLYYYNTDNLVFDNCNSIDYVYFNNLINEINHDTIDMDKFKEICRSEYWRNLWSDSKHSLINDPVCDWSEEQKTLCSLSRMYDRIYEHPECPSDDIINDNDALDGWMIDQRRQNLKQKQEKGVNNMLSEKVKNSSEVFLMANNREQADSIIDFNDQQGRNRLEQKLNIIKSSQGPVLETQFPDVQQEIIKQRSKQQRK